MKVLAGEMEDGSATMNSCLIPEESEVPWAPSAVQAQGLAQDEALVS